MRRGLIIGFIGWLLATLLFRQIGQYVIPGPNLVFLVSLLLGGVVVAMLAAVLTRLACPPDKIARFGAGVTIPGLFGAAATTLAFEVVFPNIDPADGVLFGAMMLWAYAIVLTVIVLFGEKIVKPD